MEALWSPDTDETPQSTTDTRLFSPRAEEPVGAVERCAGRFGGDSRACGSFARLGRPPSARWRSGAPTRSGRVADRTAPDPSRPHHRPVVPVAVLLHDPQPRKRHGRDGGDRGPVVGPALGDP